LEIKPGDSISYNGAMFAHLLAAGVAEPGQQEPWWLWPVVLGLILFIYVVHRLLLALERRGLLRYSSAGYAARSGPALLEFQTLFEPGKRYVVEQKRKQKKEEESRGGPDKTRYYDQEDQ
jgi:hypothetical protein